MRAHTAALRSLLCLAVAVAAGCGGDETPKERSGEEDRLLQTLPRELRALYDGLPARITPSAYDDFGPVKPPWKLCYLDYPSSAYDIAIRNEIKRLAAKFERAGKVSGVDFFVTDADVAQESQQVRASIDRGCSAILLYAASPSGANAAIKEAFDKGIPTIVVAQSTTSPYAIDVTPNWALMGRRMAEGIAERVGRDGSVLQVSGIEGVPASTDQDRGADEVWSRDGAPEVVSRVNGEWDANTTKSVVLRTLATHPGKIDAVWTAAGKELRTVAEAFRQAGRPVPIVTGTPAGDVLAYMQKRPGVDFFGEGMVPLVSGETAFRVAVRVLEGQRPKLKTLAFPLPQWDRHTLSRWFAPCMREASVTPFPIPPEDVLSETALNRYFVNGKATPPYRYDPPNPC